MCLTRWDTICVSCYNGIVHSHQLCCVESAFTYTFKDFLLSAMHVVFDSCSEIGLLHFSWLVKFVVIFGTYRRNCGSDQGKYGHLSRDVWVH